METRTHGSYVRSMVMFIALGAALISGCSTAITASQRSTPSGMDLAQGWPSGANHPVAEPFGVAQNIRKPGRTLAPNIDEYLKPAAMAKSETSPQKPKPAPRVELDQEAQPAEVIEVSPAPEPIAALLPTPALSSDADRYADREVDAKAQQEFRGGDRAIVITSGAVLLTLIILLIVLIVT